MPDKHPLRTLILGTAIGGLVLAFFLWFAGYIPSIWQACKSASIWLFRFLLSSVPVPVWLIFLLSPLIVFTMFLIFADLRKKDVDHQNWRNDKQDEIMGMRWHWRYSSYTHIIENLWCFCPDDYTELISSDAYIQVSFQCETCRKEFGPFQGNLNYVLGMVERQIRRKLRTDEWKAVVERLG